MKENSKIRHIEYVKLEKQTYLSSPLFTNEDVYLLFLCAQGLWTVKKTSRVCIKKVKYIAPSVEKKVTASNICSNVIYWAKGSNLQISVKIGLTTMTNLKTKENRRRFLLCSRSSWWWGRKFWMKTSNLSWTLKFH